MTALGKLKMESLNIDHDIMFRRIRLHIPGQIGPPVVGALSRKDDPPEGTRHY